MKTKFLLPNSLKKVGWVLFIAMLILFVWDTLDDLSGRMLTLSMPHWLVADIYTILPVGFSIALLMIAFAREKVEDEYIMKIRGDSLIFAVVGNYIVIIIGSLIFYSFTYFSFMAYNMFTVIVLYIIKFNITLYRLRKSARYEE